MTRSVRTVFAILSLLGAVAAEPPAGATPASDIWGGLGCGLSSHSEPLGDGITEVGVVSGGPFAVPEATSVTVTCTVSVGNAAIGDQQPPEEVTVSTTSQGMEGGLSELVRFSAPTATDVFLCTAVSWTTADGTTHDLASEPSGSRDDCDVVPEVSGTYSGSGDGQAHAHANKPKHKGKGDGAGGNPLPPCDPDYLRAQLGSLSASGDHSHYVWNAAFRAYVTDSTCAPILTAKITVRDTSTFGPAYQHTDSKTGAVDVTVSSSGPDVPYVGRATARVEVTGTAYNNDGTGAAYCSQTDTYDVTYTPAGPSLSTPSTTGTCTP